MMSTKMDTLCYIGALSDKIGGMDKDLFYYRAMTSMMTYVLNGMTPKQAYGHYFSPISEYSVDKLRNIVNTEILNAKFVCDIILDLRASVRDSIVSHIGIDKE